MTNYTTLDRCKEELKANSTIDDSDLFRYIIQVSQRIDSTMGTPRRSFFAPYTEQRQYQIETYRVDSIDNTLPLLAISSLPVVVLVAPVKAPLQ